MNTIVINEEIVELIHQEFREFYHELIKQYDHVPPVDLGIEKIRELVLKYVNIPSSASEEVADAITQEMFRTVIFLELKQLTQLEDEESP